VCGWDHFGISKALNFCCGMCEFLPCWQELFWKDSVVGTRATTRDKRHSNTEHQTRSKKKYEIEHFRSCHAGKYSTFLYILGCFPPLPQTSTVSHVQVSTDFRPLCGGGWPTDGFQRVVGWRELYGCGKAPETSLPDEVEVSPHSRVDWRQLCFQPLQETFCTPTELSPSYFPRFPFRPPSRHFRIAPSPQVQLKNENPSIGDAFGKNNVNLKRKGLKMTQVALHVSTHQNLPRPNEQTSLTFIWGMQDFGPNVWSLELCAVGFRWVQDGSGMGMCCGQW